MFTLHEAARNYLESLYIILQWLAKLRLESPPINDKNACVCSEHFNEEDFVTAILPAFGPTKPTLKAEAVPTKFCFAPVPKLRKTSEARIARAERRDIIEELTFISSPSTSTCGDGEATCFSVLPVKPTTRDIGVQCD